MNKWKKRGIYAAVYFFACALTVWDVENKFWIAPLIVWAAGTYLLYKRLNPIIEEEIALLKQSDNSSDFICAFVSGAVVFAFTIFLLIVGFSGRFDFNIAEGVSFLYIAINGLVILFGFVMILFGVYFLLALGVSLLLGNNEHSNFGAKLLPFAVYFILLSYCCGIIDIVKLIDIISKISASIAKLQV